MPGLIKFLFQTFFLGLVLSVTTPFPFPAAFAEESSPHNEVFQKALQLRDEGNFQDAELEFKRAMELEPDNPSYRFELANLYAIRHDDALSTNDDGLASAYLSSSASELQQALMIQPDFWSARFNLGVVYKKQGKYEAARVEFKKVLQQNPEVLAALMQIGQTYAAQGFYDEAESIYEDARDRGVPDPEIALAMQELDQGRYQEHRQNQSEMGRSLNGLSQKLNSNYLNSANPNNSAGTGQAIGGLGSVLMQQFMQGRAQNKNQNNNQW